MMIVDNPLILYVDQIRLDHGKVNDDDIPKNVAVVETLPVFLFAKKLL